MIAIDTNVLVRLLVQDDPAQWRAATALVAGAESRGDEVYLDDLVLAETAWVLRTTYDVAKTELIELFHGVLGAAVFAFTDREVFKAAVETFTRTSAQFADCLIVARNAAAGCGQTMTFDRGMRGLPATHLLTTS